MVKKGDTLVEVAIAIGIFSLIAIAVASVMGSGSSGAQLSLETTLTREEIDAQADALRFIQNSYIANKENPERPLPSLWRTITENAISTEGKTENQLKDILQYAPTSCSEFYENTSSLAYQNAFIINPRALKEKNSAAYIKIKDNPAQFAQASTYPRLIFGNATNNSDNNNLSDNSWDGANFNNLWRAEGIYIIAVKDSGSTKIVDTAGETEETASAYYDFYIRTCWYGAGNQQPSSISTVIRLHNPEVTQVSGGKVEATIQGVYYSPRIKIVTPEPSTPRGYEFLYWCSGVVTDESCDSQTYPPNQAITNPNEGILSIKLEPVFRHVKYTINYDTNGGAWNDDGTSSSRKQVCYEDADNGNCPVLSDAIGYMGRKFIGWCNGTISSTNGTDTCSGDTYLTGSNIAIPGGFPSSRVINLKAMWRDNNETFTIRLTWGSSPRDLDSHLKGQRSDNEFFHTFYSEKTYSEGRTIASLDVDDTNGYGPETITLNTLGGRTFYYYVYCFSGCSKISDATVVLTNTTTGATQTFKSNDATGSGEYWNVFALKSNGVITRQTHSDTEEISY